MCNVTGITVAVHIHSSNPPVGNEEERLTGTINATSSAVKKCAPSVEQLVQQYKQTSVDSEKSRFKERIRKRYRKALKGVTPRKLLPYHADLLTVTALTDIKVNCAAHIIDCSIVLYCEVSTVEALLNLQQMIDSGELSELFSRMLSLLANTDVTATASLSSQEHTTALTFLTSAAGKTHLI